MVDSSLLIKTTKSIEIYREEILLKDEKIPYVISVNRNDSTVSRQSTTSSKGNTLSTLSIIGIYGIIELCTSKYLIVITDANYVGEILGKKLLQVKKLTYIPLTAQIEINSIKSLKYPSEDKTYIEMLNHFFHRKYLYFSFEYDLTSSLQQFIDNNRDRTKWRNAYFFNELLMQDFVKQGFYDWISPVISGLVEVNHLQVNGNDCDLIILSRRDKSRTGMRFVSRGCDLDGNASNTAETEQIFVMNKKSSTDIKIFSFVQLRGSMPFLW